MLSSLSISSPANLNLFFRFGLSENLQSDGASIKPGTRNIPEHAGTCRNIPEHEKIKIIFMKNKIN